MRQVSTTAAAVRDAIRRHPWWSDSVLALILTVIAVGSTVVSRTRYGFAVPVLAVVVTLFTTVPIAVRRYRPLAVLAVTVIAETLLLIFRPGAGAPVGVIVALYTVAAYCDRRVSIRAAALAALPITVAVIVNNRPHAGQVIPELAVFAIAWVVGDNLRTRRAYLAELEARAARLEREREENATRATLEERSRIARELHDVIAHNVSVMVVQASAGDDVFETDPARAREALAAVASTGRDALGELRRLLGVIRPGDDDVPSFAPQPGIARLDELIEQVRDTGLSVTLSVDGAERAVPEAASLCVYRIVQEALTNTLKHAHATSAQVSLSYDLDELRVRVSDDGRGVSDDSANGDQAGHGLIGMRERVALFGGEVTTGPSSDRGYGVSARIPVAPEGT